MSPVIEGELSKMAGRHRTHRRKSLWGHLVAVVGRAVSDADRRLRVPGFLDFRRRRGVRLSRQGVRGHVSLLER